MKDTQRELLFTRIFDAPRELVFKAWTDPQLLAQWWGPQGVTNPVCEFEASVGGTINIVMLAGEELGDLAGQQWPMKGVIKEYIPPKKLVFIADAMRDGKQILENLNTVTFEEEGDKTKMTLHVVVMEATKEAEGPLQGMKIGWSQSLDKLADFTLFLKEQI